MELREKIKAAIHEATTYSPQDHESYTDAGEAADRILAIPEIREGLYLYSRKKVKAGKPSREPTLGHSIGTKP
jgi:hypothetical protein